MSKKTNSKTLTDLESYRRIWDNKTEASKGVTIEQLISLFYKIPLKRVEKMNYLEKNKKKAHLRYLKFTWLTSTFLAVINKDCPKGYVIYNEFGKTVLTRNKKIFFRCTRLDDASKFRRSMDNLGDGIKRSGENTIKTFERMQKENQKIVMAKILENKSR